jgi:hypothetical protein
MLIIIEKNSVPEFETTKELKNWIVANLSIIGDIAIKSNSRVVRFSKDSIGRSLKGAQRNEIKKQTYSALRVIAEYAILGGIKNADKKHENTVKGQELYYNVGVYDEQLYAIEISVDIPHREGQHYVYAGHKAKKIPSAANGFCSLEGLSDNTGGINFSITDIVKLFNAQEKSNSTEKILRQIKAQI